MRRCASGNLETRVSLWTTVNEPNVLEQASYDQGVTPPHRCSPPFGITSCDHGNLNTEPYLALHHILLAHSSTIELYRRKYQEKQRGLIGITLYAYGFVPFTNSTEDVQTAQRAKEFLIGWVAEPLVHGEYPEIMRRNAGSRLPTFTSEELEMVKGSFDFLGIIHYMQVQVKDNSKTLDLELRDFNADMGAQVIETDSYFVGFSVTPWALRDILEDFKQFYGNPPLHVLENANYGILNGVRSTRNASLNDTKRVEYLHHYIGAVLEAIRNECNVKGYSVWSILDVFEIFTGFPTGFGLYYVDLEDPELTRHPKLSAHWYSHFLKGGTVGSFANIQLAANVSGELRRRHASQ